MIKVDAVQKLSKFEIFLL